MGEGERVVKIIRVTTLDDHLKYWVEFTNGEVEEGTVPRSKGDPELFAGGEAYGFASYLASDNGINIDGGLPMTTSASRDRVVWANPEIDDFYFN